MAAPKAEGLFDQPQPPTPTATTSSSTSGHAGSPRVPNEADRVPIVVQPINYNEVNELSKMPLTQFMLNSPAFSTGLFLSVLEQARLMASRLPRLLRIQSPVAVFGDMHGNLANLSFFYHKITQTFGYRQVLFSGDVVDREPYGADVIFVICLHIIGSQGKVMLLRGNHECSDINARYGLLDEVKAKFGAEGNTVYNAMNNFFNALPLAALVDGKCLVCHGGLPETLTSLEEINQIPVPISAEDLLAHPIASQLLWNDPTTQCAGFAPNDRRQVGAVFGPQTLDEAGEKLGITCMLRAHNPPANGVEGMSSITGNVWCHTVFSSYLYGSDVTSSAVFLINEVREMGPKTNGRPGNLMTATPVCFSDFHHFANEHWNAEMNELGVKNSNRQCFRPHPEKGMALQDIPNLDEDVVTDVE